MPSDKILKRKAVSALLAYSFTGDDDEMEGKDKEKREIGLEDVRKKDLYQYC